MVRKHQMNYLYTTCLPALTFREFSSERIYNRPGDSNVSLNSNSLICLALKHTRWCFQTQINMGFIGYRSTYWFICTWLSATDKILKNNPCTIDFRVDVMVKIHFFFKIKFIWNQWYWKYDKLIKRFSLRLSINLIKYDYRLELFLSLNQYNILMYFKYTMKIFMILYRASEKIV